MRRLSLLLFPAAILPALAHADDPPCNTWEVEYTLAAQVRLSDTAMGAGDGVHAIGPGKAILHFDNVNGQPGGNVKLMTYEMTDQFTVNAHMMGVGTTVVNDTKTRTTPNICGVSAQGTYADRVVRWSTLWNGVHTDGKVNCAGSMCGHLGAPPTGDSEVHQPALPRQFKPFEFAPDLKTFHMDYAVTSKMTSPSQTSSITFNGREARRSCIYVRPCP